ncbi:platelet-activating factor receptor [Alligator mississippiensis]|uniref:Platelet-activating factor receptor n=1 Tax=Alligator mississippiensis TaxID=8496 RepID=A0A151PG37_ALLMI|nr:platelet-activating factor receptor [Alligator mississippiensis]
MMNGSVDGLAGLEVPEDPGACEPRDPMQFLLVPLVYCLVLCVGLPGNLMALLVFLQSSKVRKAIRIYLINLTLADILFNLTLPLWIPYYFARGHWVLSEAACRVAGAAYFLATYSAIIFMTLISVDRYCTVRVARLDLVLNRRRGAGAACVVAWLLCLCSALPSVVVQQTFPMGTRRVQCFEQYAGQRSYACAMVGLFVLSFLVVMGSYVSIMRSLSDSATASQGAHRRLARAMVLGMLLVFAVCVAPYHFILVPWMDSHTGAPHCRPPSTLDNLHTLSVALLSLNSCIDPLIYCFSIKRFRADLWRTARKILRCLPPPPSPLERAVPHVRSSSFISS